MRTRTRLLIIRLLSQHAAEMRHARNLSRDQLGVQSPMTRQHHMAFLEAEDALKDFTEELDYAAQG